jgi:hypothetical protein
MNRTIAALAAGTLLASSASSQTEFLMLAGDSAGDRFGHSLAGVGDVDGDLVPDWAVGAPYDTPAGPMSGSVRVISGATGSQLFEFEGDSELDLFGYSVSGGDVDGDGLADVIVGAYGDDSGGGDSGSVYVFSGFDGALLYHFKGAASGDNLGFSVAFVPDTDGDGRGEVLAGARASDISAKNAGSAVLFSGATGQPVLTVTGEVAFDLFGSSVAGLDDVDGDGLGDLLVGAVWNDHSGSGAGSAYVFSGSTGSLLHALRGLAAADSFGSALADAGDVDGDGRSDLFIGAPGADLSGANSGSASVFSGATGTHLYTFTGDHAGDFFGSTVAGDLNVDDDGFSDLIVGALAADEGGLSAGMVRVFSGVSGLELLTVHGNAAGDRFGAAVAAGGDVDLDGRDELLVGAWGENPGQGPFTGALHVLTFSEAEPPVYSYCTAGTNTDGLEAELWYSGSTSIEAGDLVLVCEKAMASQPGLFFYGAVQVEVPFGDGFRCVGGSIYRLDVASSDPFGSVQYTIDYDSLLGGPGEIFSGSNWNFQYWYRDPKAPSGFNLSNGLSATFFP